MNRSPAPVYLLSAVLTFGALALYGPAGGFAVASSPQGEPTSSASSPQATTPATTTAAPSTTETSPTTPAPASSPEGEAGTQTSTAPASSTEGEAAPPQVSAQRPQSASPSGASSGPRSGQTKRRRANKSGAPGEGAGAEGARAKHKAPLPSTLTPSLPFSLRAPIGSIPDFFIESFQIPPFLLPIFQAAGSTYGIPWQVLAAINEVETDYGRDLSLSSAGAEGWMQFLPSEWAQYGVDANGDGWEDPYNPADAIFAAARYLHAAGGATNIRAAVFAYNHSQSYVESVLLRAQLLSGTPAELLGAITGLTESRFPVHAPSHFSDGFPIVSVPGSTHVETLAGTTIYSQAGAPVIAVQDGEVVQIGDSPSLGHFVMLRDAYGNTYVYAQLGEVASVYPVLQPRLHSQPSARIAGASSTNSKAEPAPTGPATAGVQPHSPLSEGAAISGLAFGAAASLESMPGAPVGDAARAVHIHKRPRSRPQVQSFSEGANEVYLHPLVPGVQVIAGTVLGHLGEQTGAGPSTQGEAAPHMLFQIRPAGVGAPLIDPKPILDGWVALEDTSVFRARGENPFLATSPTVGQVLLESKQQLEPQVLHDEGIHLSTCARQDVQEGRVDKRVLAMLEYLSVSGLHPNVSGLPCAPSTPAALAANAPAQASSEAVAITAVNGIPIAGHQAPGSIADQTVRKLLMLEGLSRPQRIVSLMSYPGAAGTLTSASAANAIHIAYATPGGSAAHAAALSPAGLSPSEWVALIDRLGQIPDPTVGSGHSSAAIPDSQATNPSEGAGGGDY